MTGAGTGNEQISLGSKNDEGRAWAEGAAGAGAIGVGRSPVGLEKVALCAQIGGRDPQIIMTKEAETRPC